MNEEWGYERKEHMEKTLRFTYGDGISGPNRKEIGFVGIWSGFGHVESIHVGTESTIGFSVSYKQYEIQKRHILWQQSYMTRGYFSVDSDGRSFRISFLRHIQARIAFQNLVFNKY